MIRPLRKRHLIMQSSLALVVLIGMVQGLRLRQPMPTSNRAPFDSFAEENGQIVPGLPVTVHLMSESTLLLHLREPLKKPDVLLYVASASPPNLQLPSEVFLLGAVGNSNRGTFFIPEAARSEELHLILYSLAHQEVIGTVLLEEHS